MKSTSDSMSPDEAAKAFFGQDDATFALTIAKLTKNDQRLAKAFHTTRQAFLKQDSTSADH